MHPKRYLDLKQEAARLGVGTATIERLRRNEQFPFIRLGTRILYDPELSDQFLAARVHHGQAAELAKANA